MSTALTSAAPATGYGFTITMAPPVPLAETPGPFVATPEALLDWAIEAEQGARCVYARVVNIAHHARLRDQVAQLAKQGVIVLQGLSRYEPGSGLFNHIAKRSCVAFAAAADVPEPSRSGDLADGPALTASARRVLDLVARRADQGAPLDSNRGIASATGLKDADAAAYQLRVLREKGLILLKPVPVEPGRVATVIETGARTGLIGREARR